MSRRSQLALVALPLAVRRQRSPRLLPLPAFMSASLRKSFANPAMTAVRLNVSRSESVLIRRSIAFVRK